MPRLLVVLLVAALVSACAGDGADQPVEEAAGQDGLVVVATTTILGDLVEQVVGDDGEVDVLMAPGQDPHGFSPSAQQVQQLRDADLVVANGLGLEAAFDDALEAATEDGTEVLVVGPELDPLPLDEDAAAAHDGASQDHADDPHVWFDPTRMATAMDVVAERLAGIDDTTDWASRADEVGDLLEDTDAEVRSILEEVREECRRLVTNHEAFGYLADRYDFEVVGTVVPGTSTQAAASARDFAELAQLLRDTGVRAIFSETSVSTQLASTLASEVGGEVEVVDLYTGSLGEPDSGADTYVGLLLTDARLIADALADC